MRRILKEIAPLPVLSLAVFGALTLGFIEPASAEGSRLSEQQQLQWSEDFQKSLPDSIAVLGDSISAGTFAEYTVKSWRNPLKFWTLMGKLTAVYVRKDYDSIENRELSWATGTGRKPNINSVATRVNGLRNKKSSLAIANFSKTGFTSGEILGAPLEQMLQWSAEELGQGAPDSVLLFMGANDVCEETEEGVISVEEFKANVDTVLNRIYSRHPQSKVLMMEIPDLKTMWEQHKDARASRSTGLRTCQDVWSFTNFCNNMLDGTEESRARGLEVIQGYNASLAELAEEYADYDVRVADKVFETKVELDDLSIDCFHPSPRGQARLAEEAWNTSWWTGKAN